MGPGPVLCCVANSSGSGPSLARQVGTGGAAGDGGGETVARGVAKGEGEAVREASLGGCFRASATALMLRHLLCWGWA